MPAPNFLVICSPEGEPLATTTCDLDAAPARVEPNDDGTFTVHPQVHTWVKHLSEAEYYIYDEMDFGEIYGIDALSLNLPQVHFTA